MTSESEAVERALDSEWRPTREIIERAGLQVTEYNVTHYGKRLRALVRQGYAERMDGQLQGCRSRGAVWRRKA